MNIKKIIAGIMAVCVIGGVLPSVNMAGDNAVIITANAEDETADYTKGTYEQLTYKNYGDHIEISGCDIKATEVEIPAEIDGLPVTNINSCAFEFCTNLISVTIPDSVTTIGSGAFEYCTSLVSVTIPDSITSIEDRTFYNCTNLTSITIPGSVTSIGVSAFFNCEKLTSVTIPDSVTSIGIAAFAICTSLISIEIPESVTYIDGSSFANTAWLEERRQENPLVAVNNILIDGHTCSGDVVIPENITNIGGQTFTSCSDLTSVTIPDSVMSIGVSAFFNCKKLTSITILNPDCDIYDNSNVISDTATIYGYESSTAQTYAEKYGYKFEVISETAEEIIGDANGDNTVDLADATSIIQHIGNPGRYALSEQGLANADCNSDNKVTGADAIAIQKLEAKQISKLPYTE